MADDACVESLALEYCARSFQLTQGSVQHAYRLHQDNFVLRHVVRH